VALARNTPVVRPNRRSRRPRRRRSARRDGSAYIVAVIVITIVVIIVAVPIIRVRGWSDRQSGSKCRDGQQVVLTPTCSPPVDGD
jgi:hypothetical protein